MRDLLLEIDPTRKQRSLEAALRAAIRADGSSPVRRCHRVAAWPPTSTLARATVVAAYDQLVAEGYLRSRPGATDAVAAGPWTTDDPVARPARPDFRLDLNPRRTRRRPIPRAAWLRCTREVLATAPDELFGYGDPSGLLGTSG